ncbi:MAG: DUF6691 family protein [Alphaproteobacteria bacterium]
MARLVVALIAGIVFGLGLAVSSMVDAGKVLAFLDLAGAWDPSLALVMAGALAIALPGFHLARRRGAPTLAMRFEAPKAKSTDLRLVSGAALFGVGWGLVGLCPGPAIASIGYAIWQAPVFLVAMAVGAWVAGAVSAGARSGS